VTESTAKPLTIKPIYVGSILCVTSVTTLLPIDHYLREKKKIPSALFIFYAPYTRALGLKSGDNGDANSKALGHTAGAGTKGVTKRPFCGDGCGDKPL
jgi:hypothetical protein